MIRLLFRSVRQLFWFAIALAGLYMLGQLLWLTRDWTPVIAQWLDDARLWLALWRAALFIALIGLWPIWIKLFAQCKGWTPQHHSFVLAQRWRIATWLIVLELILVQGILARFFQEIG